MIVSYYTKDTPYEEVIKKYLIPSLDKFKLKYQIEGVPNLGSWKANTDYKPKFILNALKKYNRVIWLDADAEIVQYPTELFKMSDDYDIGVFYLDWGIHYGHSNGKKELVSSVAVFNQNSIPMVKYWLKKSRVFTWEQQALEKALELNDVKVYNLPKEYCTIIKKDNGLPEYIKEPVIVQHQVSRILKKEIK